jgi:hypothetical protein
MATQRVFISYRRSDTCQIVERMFDVLATLFGPENVFRDVDSIDAGKSAGTSSPDGDRSQKSGERSKKSEIRSPETEVGIRNAARPFCILTPDSRLLQHNSVT